MSFETPSEPTMQEVMVQLHQLEAQFTIEGNKDSEPDQLRSIRERLMGGSITPAQARTEAQAIVDGRIER